jgi:hypothetical protein
MVFSIAIICIVLASGLVGVIVVYVSTVSDLRSQAEANDGTIASLNLQISSLNSRISSLTNSLNQSNSNNVALTSQIAQLQQLVADCYEKLALTQYGYLASNMQLSQDAGVATSIWMDYVEYAGYVIIQVESTSNTTYARVLYSLASFGIDFDYSAIVGTSGTTVFPVLPGLLTVSIGNTENVEAVNATVTAVYYY